MLGTAHIRSDGRAYPVKVWLQAGLHKDDSLWRSVLSGLRLKNEGEARLLRIQHFYEVFAKINYAIIHSRDTAELFQSICDTAVTLKMCDVAWIGMLKQREVTPVASAGMSLQRVRSRECLK